MNGQGDVAFPSLRFFELLRDVMNAQPAKYERLGWCDMRLVCAVTSDEPLLDDEYYGVEFEAFACRSVEQVSAGSATEAMDRFDADCVLAAYSSTWCRMIENIVARGAADRTHTLNSLTLPDVPMRAFGPDPARSDRFLRYNQTLQSFFDDASRVRPAPVTRGARRTAPTGAQPTGTSR